MKVLLSLESRKLRNDGINPKSYPYCEELVQLLKKKGWTTIQVRCDDDPTIKNVDEVFTNLSLKELEELIKECDTFIAVDNFVQHYASYLGKKGTVIFSRSDPAIYGHPDNANILKSKNYLRPGQYGTWEEDIFVKEAFVSPQFVVDHMIS